MGPLGVRMGPGVAKKRQKCTQKGLHWEKIEKDLKIRQKSAVFWLVGGARYQIRDTWKHDNLWVAYGRGGAKNGKKCAQIGLQLEWMEKNEKKFCFFKLVGGAEHEIWGTRPYGPYWLYWPGGGQKKPNKGPRNASNGRA